MQVNVPIKGIVIDENNNASVPCEVSIKLLNNRSLKAVVKLQFAGFIINDIRIIENRGNTEIIYPQTTFHAKSGEEIFRAVAFPSTTSLSKTLNHCILNAYSEACMEQIGAIAHEASKAA